MNGQLLDGKVLKTFTHEQLENGLVQFVHDGSEKRPSLILTVKDSDGLSVTKKIDFSGTAFQAVNDVATVTTSRVTLAEGVDVKLRNFTIRDSDSRAADSVITLDWNGEDSAYVLKVDGEESHSFTYAQMLAGKVNLRLLNQDKSSNLFYSVDDVDGGITSGSLSVVVKHKDISKNEKPHVEAAGAFIFISNGSRVLDDSFLKVVDPLTSASGISINAVGVVNGSFQINGKAVTSFTLQELKDGLVSFLHNPNNGNGEPRFNLKFSYFGGGTDVLHGNLLLEMHQTPMIISPSSLTINEDESIDGTVTSSDAGASPTYTLISDTKHGILSLEGNSYSYTPDENFNGFDSFVLAVTNEYGAVSSQAVSIIIKPVNDLVEGEVAISGVLMEGGLLSADTSDLSDVEGMGTLHFQWLRDGNEIPGGRRCQPLLGRERLLHRC